MRFYFDIDDGEQQVQDDTGLELADPSAARDAAIEVLPDIAREHLPGGTSRAFMVEVRAENGVVIFRAKLALTSEWTSDAHVDATERFLIDRLPFDLKRAESP